MEKEIWANVQLQLESQQQLKPFLSYIVVNIVYTHLQIKDSSVSVYNII